MEKDKRNVLQIILDWISGIFDKDSSISSKRLSGVLMITWALTLGTYYVYKTFHGTPETSALSLIQFTLATGAGLLGTGTLVERLGKSDKKDNKDEKL